MSHCILVVDDDPAILDIVCWTLEDEGFLTARAQDGVEALDVIHRQPPDLILLDLRMPRLNGWELFQILANDPFTHNIPVVIMTADQSGIPTRQLLRSVPLLAKPFNLEDLVDTVSQALN